MIDIRNIIFSFFLVLIITFVNCRVFVEDTGRISNGITAAPHQFPWHAALVKEDGHKPFCGGTLIGAYWVLTAEHCVAKEKNRIPRIFAGYINRTDPVGTGGAIAQTEEIIRYSAENQEGDHDIALIKLKTPLFESNTIKHARLPEKDLQIWGRIAYAMGHGRQDEEKEIPKPEVLLYTEMKIMEKENCNSKHYICTKALYTNSTPCPGDSGGSLILKGTNILLGADHAGDRTCGHPQKTTYFTKVVLYLDWIREKTGIVP